MKATALAANRLMEETGTKDRHKDIAHAAFQELKFASAMQLTDWVNKHYPRIAWDDYESVRRACDLEDAQVISPMGKIGKSRKGNKATVWQLINTEQ